MLRPFLALYAGGHGRPGRQLPLRGHRPGGLRGRGHEDPGAVPGRQQGRTAIAAVPTEMVEALALIGPPEKIRDDLEAWKEAVVTTMLVSGPPAAAPGAGRDRAVTRSTEGDGVEKHFVVGARPADGVRRHGARRSRERPDDPVSSTATRRRAPVAGGHPPPDRPGAASLPTSIGMGDSDKLADSGPTATPSPSTAGSSTPSSRRARADRRRAASCWWGTTGARRWGSTGPAAIPGAVDGIAYMEAIVCPGHLGRLAGRGPGDLPGCSGRRAGEELILERELLRREDPARVGAVAPVGRGDGGLPPPVRRPGRGPPPDAHLAPPDPHRRRAGRCRRRSSRPTASGSAPTTRRRSCS